MNKRRPPISRYFKKSEFQCKCGCGGDFVSPQLVEMLDNARGLAGVPFVINSAYRCEPHNNAVGGAAGSAHMAGLAVDIAAPDAQTRFTVVEALLEAGFTRIGINFEKSFIHADIDKTRPQNVIFKY